MTWSLGFAVAMNKMNTFRLAKKETEALNRSVPSADSGRRRYSG